MAKHDVYMPLMMGDWIKGTRGMKAAVRGVYIGLLLFQWDNHFIPSDMEELILIEPEVKSVWEKLSNKFNKISETQLQNEKLEEVRAFFSKQKTNGSKGGRPKNNNPNNNPKPNPNNNLHNEFEYNINNNNINLNKKGVEKSVFKIAGISQNQKPSEWIKINATISIEGMALKYQFTDPQWKDLFFKFDCEKSDLEFENENNFKNSFKKFCEIRNKEITGQFTKHNEKGYPVKISKTEINFNSHNEAKEILKASHGNN